jgi:hypothetical protein
LRVPKGDKIYNTLDRSYVSKSFIRRGRDFIIITRGKKCLKESDEKGQHNTVPKFSTKAEAKVRTVPIYPPNAVLVNKSIY